MVLKLPHPGSLVAFAILGLVAGGFIALASFDGGTPALLSIGPYLGRVLAFSITQAALSTVLSLVLGIGLALALARRRFPGRDIVLAILGTTMVHADHRRGLCRLRRLRPQRLARRSARVPRVDGGLQHLRLSRHPDRPRVPERPLRGADHARRVEPGAGRALAPRHRFRLHALPDLPPSRLAGAARGTSRHRRPDLPDVLQELRHRAGARRRTEPLHARSGDLRGAQDRPRFRPRRLARPDPACDLPVDDGPPALGLYPSARRPHDPQPDPSAGCEKPKPEGPRHNRACRQHPLHRAACLQRADGLSQHART